MDSNTLKHYGIPGMKWRVRRFQNEDGSLTPAGQKRYGIKNSNDQLTNLRKNHVTLSNNFQTNLHKTRAINKLHSLSSDAKENDIDAKKKILKSHSVGNYGTKSDEQDAKSKIEDMRSALRDDYNNERANEKLQELKSNSDSIREKLQELNSGNESVDQKLQKRLRQINMQKQYKQISPAHVDTGKEAVRQAVKNRMAFMELSAALSKNNKREKLKTALQKKMGGM